ncbi:centrosome-associated zinc finger protein CP190 isoform X2 [Rhynchophorus ferrugineus]|uniref:centrosome-associated zinc finger protein CP190 isoform X2 n=1 Tax=Rhynchophorus ferrugineus TaxID=354439 RepID=UPI003FCDDD53
MNSNSIYQKGSKMVESSKQVRVDNWGIYFLQRLQLFFSKTDYCDLTLQFEGNVQLKVHRLVMNACTEYFTFLEQTCPALEENTIMMPTELQADVIVPIVNFMYTGMLEFHPSIYDKLFKAAETMNIAVLMKLLAQLQSKNPKVDKKESTNNLPVKKFFKPTSPLSNDLSGSIQSRKPTQWRRSSRTQSLAVTNYSPASSFTNSKWTADPVERDPLFVDNKPKPTRFEWPDDDFPPVAPLDSTFDEVSLTSKPLWTKEDDQKAGHSEDDQDQQQSGSKDNSISQDFDEEYPSKNQKVNMQVDEQVNTSDATLKRKSDTKSLPSPKRIKITDQDDETVISIRTNNPSELDHTKIVSEILKKFPDLMKKKKNIKLKIISAKNEQPQIKVQTPKEKPKAKAQIEKPVQTIRRDSKSDNNLVKEPQSQKDSTGTKTTRQKADFRGTNEDGPWTCIECLGHGEAPEFVLYYLYRKHMTDVHGYEFDNSLCKYCGRKCVSSMLMAYHLFTKHLLIPPPNISFPKCTLCPFIAVSTEKINEHIATHGKDDVQCQNCKLGFFTKKDLAAHIQITKHNQNKSQGKSTLDCPYCMKLHQSPVGLFNHIRAQHIKEANRDGITSLNEKMDFVDSESPSQEEVPAKDVPIPASLEKPDEKQVPHQKERVKILSNVKVREEGDTSSVHNIPQPPTPDANQIAVTTAATGLSNIGGSLATNLGLVDIVVLDDNQPYILQQPQGQPGNTEFILPELGTNEGILQAATAASNINSTDELVMVLTDHDYQDEQNQGQGDNSNIVVLYSHPVEGQQQQFITSQGNLLVNSQGMLEIRNGAGITTTAGQILVNTSNNTTTTQATPSPIESIEMIRKEIEDSAVESETKKIMEGKSKEQTVSKPVAVPEKDIMNEIESVKEPEQVEPDGVTELETTDSLQPEPMEVDDIIPAEGKEEEQSVPVLEEKEDNVVKDDIIVKAIEKSVEESDIESIKQPEYLSDIPSDMPPIIDTETVSCTEIPSEPALKPSVTLEETKHTLILNDLEEYENMEVSELDCNAESQVNDVPETAETQIESLPCQDSTEPVELQEEPVHTEDAAVTETEESTKQSTVIIEEVQKPEEIVPVSEPEINKLDICTEMSLSSAKLDDSLTKTAEDCERENENNQNVEIEQNGQNESLPSNFEDFTDDSQSSSQKVQKDLNKEILEDWDDTDSQQSQKSHDRLQDAQDLESEQNKIANAAENVNKLMDDWDEEEEEQSKD